MAALISSRTGFVRPPEEQVRQWHFQPVPLRGKFQRFTDRRQGGDRGVVLLARTMQSQGVAIRKELPLFAIRVDISAQPIGRAEGIINDATELELLPVSASTSSVLVSAWIVKACRVRRKSPIFFRAAMASGATAGFTGVCGARAAGCLALQGPQRVRP